MISHRRFAAVRWMVPLFLIAAATSVSAASGGRKTLTRESDPVIITGDMLKATNRFGAETLRLYVLRKGKLEPAPYQIDRRKKDGEYISDPSDEERRAPLGRTDELVFMAKDAGDRIVDNAKPRGAGAGEEIEMTDPVDGKKGWAYLFHFEGPPPARSSVRYVSCDGDRSRVDAVNYYLKYSSAAPMVFDQLGIKPAGGGDGTDVIDRLKVRFHAETRIGIVLDRNEDQFTSELLGVINGPVRVVRRTKNRMILVANIPTPAANSDSIFYYDTFLYPLDVWVPINMGILLSRSYVRVTSESARFWGARFYNARNRKGVLIDGKFSAEEKSLDTGVYGWQIVAGAKPYPTGGWLNRLVFDRGKTPAAPKLFYVDDNGAADPPDSVPGQMGNLGYIINGVEKFGSGVHRIATYMYNLRDYRPGMEKRYLDILDRPLKVTVRARGSSR